MPKLKTKKAAAKRYRLTGKGKVKVGHKGKRHGMWNKSRKRKRGLQGSTLLTGGHETMAKSLLPYG